MCNIKRCREGRVVRRGREMMKGKKRKNKKQVAHNECEIRLEEERKKKKWICSLGACSGCSSDSLECVRCLLNWCKRCVPCSTIFYMVGCSGYLRGCNLHDPEDETQSHWVTWVEEAREGWKEEKRRETQEAQKQGKWGALAPCRTQLS